MRLSVVTCTYNPDERHLRRVFEALAAQTLEKTAWEYVIIDNNSSERWQDRFDLSWHPSLRMVTESRQGLTPARLRGIAETCGDILVFVDDDCVLDANYLEHVLDVFEKNVFMGMVGGYGRAEYEVPPPSWMMASLRAYHLDMTPPPPGYDLLYARTKPQFGPWFPAGGGMSVRRNIATQYAAAIQSDAIALAFDRTGEMLAGAGDLDLGISTMDQGYAIGKSANLRFTHLVPAFRVEIKYMLRLLYMSQYSTERLLVYRGWKEPLPYRKPTWWQKTRRALRMFRAYSEEERCWQALARGRFDGLANAPLDTYYCGD